MGAALESWWWGTSARCSKQKICSFYTVVLLSSVRLLCAWLGVVVETSSNCTSGEEDVAGRGSC